MRFRYHICVAIATIILVLWVHISMGVSSSYLEVTMLGVGQGDSGLVTDPTGYQVLIDGGPADGSILTRLESALPLFDRTIDAVLLSHPDADHVSGLVKVLEAYHVSTIFDNLVPKDTDMAHRFRSLSVEEDAQMEKLFTGDTIMLPSGAKITTLHPSESFSHPEANNHSVVMRLEYGSVSFLFTGDIDAEIESLLVETIPPQLLESTVLKIPHHGSRYSSSLNFLRHVNPQIAIASYDCNNSYGHPNPVAVARYDYLGIPVHTTCDRGSFTLQTDGRDVWVKGERE